MIKLECDRCGKDCDLQARVIDIHIVSNPNPVRVEDIGEIQLTDDNTHIRYMLCQHCYDKLGFPNPYCKDEKLLNEIRNSGTKLLERHGKWLCCSDSYECSECGADTTTPHSYCWKCGARMDKSDNDE